MRLISLTVRNYRVHKELTVEFDPSRNLIGGPNESGKSTLAEAVHRVLFLRAKTGGAIQKEMVSTHIGGNPEVVLFFEAAGVRWELEKHFSGPKGSTRLSGAGMAVLKDEEAEAKLADLLKAEAGGRANATQLAATWSHLWVWQGKSTDDPSTHTSTHRAQLIQQLQQHGVAAVLQSATDQKIAARMAEAYQEIFTPTGKPKAGSKPEISRIRLEETTTALEAARDAAARLAQAADDHARADREISEITILLPKLRADRTATESKLQEVANLRREEETHQQAHASAKARLVELSTHDRNIRELQTKLAAQTAALQPSEEKLATLSRVEESARLASQHAEISQRDASESLRHARLMHDLATAAVTAFEKSDAHQRVADRSQQAAELQQKLATLRSDLAKLPAIHSKDLTRLRKLDTESGQATAALEAMATGIEVLESTAPVLLDGKSLSPGEICILTESGDLVVGDHTRLRIRPGGGNSLATARSRVETARVALQSALQSLTLRDVDHATAVLEQRQSLDQQIDRLASQWKSLGGESLSAELTQATTERDAAHAECKRRLEQAASSQTISPSADLASARTLLTTTRDALSAAESNESSASKQATLLRKKWDDAAASLTRHREETSTARQAILNLDASITAREEAHGDERQRTVAIATARDAVSQAAATLTGTQETLLALNPDLLQADLDRFTRSLTAQESRLREAENTRLQARVRLTLDGSIDPEAELRHAEARHRAASDVHNSELRRAKAIELLHQLFSSSGEAINRALVQPLADRISGYLQCLFGSGTEARVQLTESGIDGLELVRAGDASFSFATLSGGAREQTAAAVRLALAEILAADHNGTLPILFDDAFAYSDPTRIQSLQRMLDLAAIRGLQVIVLTCTPGDYSALGAGEIRLSTPFLGSVSR